MLYCIVLYCIVLYCSVLYCRVLYCIVLYGRVLYCRVLYFCIVLYCIVLYCIVGGEPMGKNGERILWGKHFRIGNFPHFSPLKKTSKDVQFSLKWLR